MGVWLLSWKRKEKLHIDITNLDLRIVLIVALLENIRVPQFRVNSAKMLTTSVSTKWPVKCFNRSKIRRL